MLRRSHSPNLVVLSFNVVLLLLLACLGTLVECHAFSTAVPVKMAAAEASGLAVPGAFVRRFGTVAGELGTGAAHALLEGFVRPAGVDGVFQRSVFYSVSDEILRSQDQISQHHHHRKEGLHRSPQFFKSAPDFDEGGR